ncbi:MAG: hypothetical protein RL418_291, partial [Actinomycetota bacterium]
AVGRIFNGRRPAAEVRRPTAVLYAESVEDVQRGVRYAKVHGLKVAVRSGGHSWAAWSIQNDTLLIDLSKMQEIQYDESTGIASANPAVKGGETLEPFLATKGRFFNGGHCPTVGIGGFLLQGGQGWCARGWGWAAERVVAVDVVTADGDLVRADANQNQDLYWAARGAGPSFPGVVVRFYLQTFERFKHVGHSIQIYALEDFTAVMEWIYSMHADLAENIELVCVSQTMPLAEDEEPRRVLIVSGLILAESVEEADHELTKFQQCPVIENALVNVPHKHSSLAEQKEDQLRANPEHWRYFVDNIWVDGEPGEIVRAIRPLFTDLPEPAAFTIWYSMGPLRELPDMAFSLQSEAYVATYLVSNIADNDQRNRQWLNQAMASAQTVTIGQYLGDSDMTNRQLKFMADDNFSRLQQVISRFDPEGRFVRYLAHDNSKVNQNHWQL